jgi:hypothetical protein
MAPAKEQPKEDRRGGWPAQGLVPHLSSICREGEWAIVGLGIWAVEGRAWCCAVGRCGAALDVCMLQSVEWDEAVVIHTCGCLGVLSGLSMATVRSMPT